MRRISALRYLSVFLLPLLAAISFTSEGWTTFLPVILAFLVVPLLELFFSPDRTNLSERDESVRKKDPFYDWLLYLVVPVQWGFVWMFLQSFEGGESGLAIAGRVLSMGLLCGVLGINVAHELGHRNTLHEQLFAKMLLLSSLYMHFFIEHNRGHHRYVSTPEDPSSARYGESLYAFWVRSIWFSYLSAWRLERERLLKKGMPVLSLSNEMIWFQIFELSLLIVVALMFGPQVMLLFVLAALLGILLLETVNYIEHYGLCRERNGNAYARVMPMHSWNSDHVIGRIMLFELSRHSDHHYIASRKYQILRHLDESPQMPTGYPGMMVLAAFPPIWFHFMNKRIENVKKQEIL